MYKLNLLSDLLLRDTAEVTENGIFYKDKFYTCSVALREQWFSKAAKVEVWSIPIYFDPTDADYILLQLQNGFLCIGNLLVNESYMYDTKDYFNLIEQVKKKMKNRRGRLK